VFPPESVKTSGEQLPRNRLPGTDPNVFRVEHWSRFVRVVVQLAGSTAAEQEAANERRNACLMSSFM
jgi:hypothetical protein